MRRKTSFAVVASAAKKGLDRVRKVTGQEMDDDLALYARLRPEDFDRIMARYGPDATLTYIKQMEAKRMKG